MILVAAADIEIVLQEIAGAEEKIIEIHRIRRAFFRAESLHRHSQKTRKTLRRSDSRNLADPGKERFGIVALAERMPGLLRFELVGQLADFFKVSAVFCELLRKAGLRCQCGFPLILDSEIEPIVIDAKTVEPIP